MQVLTSVIPLCEGIHLRGGGVLYFHKNVGSGHFGGFKILNFNIYFIFIYFLEGGRGVRIMNIFGV